MASIDNGAWDGAQAMSDAAASDDPAAAYEAICAGRRDGDPAIQATWALPHHLHPGDPPNADGVRNSLSRLPQTQGLTDEAAAQRHLDAHMADIQDAAQSRSDDDILTTEIPDSQVEVRDLDAREIGALIAPFGAIVNTEIGLESFQPGAFAHVDPKKIVLKSGHNGPAVGRGISIEERADGAYMAFRVSKTTAGDEALTLAKDGVTRFVSIEYAPRESRGEIAYRDRQRITNWSKVGLKGIATTYKPVYEQAEVLYVREQETQGATAMAETPEAPVAGAVTEPQIDLEPFTRRIEQSFESFADRLHKLEERSRQDIVIPAPQGPKADLSRGRWMQTVLRTMTGERVSDLEMRDWADLITGDNLGVVPETFSTELLGVIDANRPFLGSTRQVPTPTSGVTLNMPVLTTRPTAGVQVNEKDAITSTETSITSTGFDAVTIAGGGDISLQLLKRSSPSYLDLYLQLLAEALSENAEAEAIAALLGAGVSAGTGTLDPAALAIGEAWVNARAVRQRADTMWLSSDAVAAFIDAKIDGTNAPLYSTLAADITVGGGPGGRVSGLRPVFVPALDGTGTDVVIGPSRGFAWAEDGAFTLQVDVPSKAGRDVALIVIDWYAPLYAAAFTTYAV